MAFKRDPGLSPYLGKMQDSLNALYQEMIRYSPDLTLQEWTEFKKDLKPTQIKKGNVIFPRTKICHEVLFIVEGIAASEHFDGQENIINRFFSSRNLCTNVVSFLIQELDGDQLFAVTNLNGILIPYDQFHTCYLTSNGIGLYFRKKLLENLIEAKKFVSMKTLSGVEAKLQFLQENYPEILLEAPWKHIASFMGVTPAWLSRNLKKKKGTSP